MTTRKLVLIDGNAIMHRAYHALPPLTNTRGEPIGAVHGMVSMLLRVIQDLEPTHIAVCFDRKEPTFRHKQFEYYQAHRPPMEEDLSSQFEKAKKVFEAMKIPYYSKAGYEADDLIGTLSEEAEKSFDQVIIITGDKDILQLVTDKTHVYYPVRGLGTAVLMKEAEVEEKLNIKPNQIVDYKALVGDPSDNYPGVFGIGPKTAEDLLKKYGDLDSIYEHLEELKESIKNKLIEKKEDAYLSRHLAEIVRDVDFEYDLEKADDWNVGNEDVIKLFEHFGFKTLTRRVKEVGKQIEESKQSTLF